MDLHKKKMLAPIIVTGIVVLYYAAFFAFIIPMLEGFWAWLLGLVPLALAAVMILVCAERIKEIRKGEEDDLSQY